jgi:hypothetical protein
MWHWSRSTGPKGPIVSKAYTDRTLILGFHFVQKNCNKVSELVKFNVMFRSLSQLEEENLPLPYNIISLKELNFGSVKV